MTTKTRQAPARNVRCISAVQALALLELGRRGGGMTLREIHEAVGSTWVSTARAALRDLMARDMARVEFHALAKAGDRRLYFRTAAGEDALRVQSRAWRGVLIAMEVIG